ncbi:hypothetical protein [Vitreimonas flagellata]|uniref:hypothetical protein n=1 Tax=Vitreimonas flagellata TaxID=2560861 RepID=UPI00107523ED|nr:hypothetical protein [Vitreimonas flagellata]
MRIRTTLIASLVLALAACGDAGTATNADAQPAQSAAANGAISDADKAAIFALLGMSPNPRGEVMNECGENSTPQFLSADLGGGAGTGILFAMGGGPTTASCYGDGSLLHLFVRDGARFREVYSDRGGVLVIMATSTNGVHDLADGGPGFSFPLWQWNGTNYAYANRSVSDGELSGATFLP